MKAVDFVVYSGLASTIYWAERHGFPATAWFAIAVNDRDSLMRAAVPLPEDLHDQVHPELIEEAKRRGILK